MTMDLTPRQLEAQRMLDRANKLRNPYDEVPGYRSDPRWHAFEEYRENVMDSLEGEFDTYTDTQLQDCAAEAAAESAGEPDR